MNGDRRDLSLDDPATEDVQLLVAICRQAEVTTDRPFKSLHAAYKAEFAEQGIDTIHDKVIFNYVFKISERARELQRDTGRTDFLRAAKEVLLAHNVRILEDGEDENQCINEDGESTKEMRIPAQNKASKKENKRRVSFDEARYEETWLSEHTETFDAARPPNRGWLSHPPVHGPPHDHHRRARSTSGQGSVLNRDPESDSFHHASPPSGYASDPDGPGDSSMLVRDRDAVPDLEPERRAELEDQLDAFLAISEIRLQRHCIRVWHDVTIQMHERGRQAYAVATSHDARLLLRQALDQWHTAFQTRRENRLIEEECERMERRAARIRGLFLARRAFEHWHFKHLAQNKVTLRAGQLFLAKRYFARWKSFTVGNSEKARSILSRKFFAFWQDRVARKLLVYEQATARHEELLQKRLFHKWYLESRSLRVEVTRLDGAMHGLLVRWAQNARHVRDMDGEAETVISRKLLDVGMSALRQKLGTLRNATARAQALRHRKTEGRWFEVLRIQGRLAPLGKAMKLRVSLALQRKAFSVWHLHLDLTRQAAEVDHRRVLQDAWTSWNDALRCRALGQRIDERVIVEALYKWVLQERMSWFRRALDGRLIQKCFSVMRDTAHSLSTSLEDRAAAFAQAQERRKLALAVTRMNMAIRQREDNERTAVEFANSRALPNVLEVWKEKTEHARQLATWAADARYYCLCSSALKKWRDRTTEHQHQRRRDAYVQVRSRMKLRLVRQTFIQWRNRGMEIHSVNGEANRRAQSRLFKVGTDAFDTWRAHANHRLIKNQQATTLDHQRLLSSALFTMQARHAELQSLSTTADAFLHEADLSVQAVALRRLQWAAFTTSQQTSSALALLARNRDHHVRQMLRHWALQASFSHASRLQPSAPEPESPSLRPAFRAAARSADRLRFRDSEALQATPGYLQTPSRPRSRRAARFRPLPTPAPQTPFAFDPGYLTTTPAPLESPLETSPARSTQGQRQAQEEAVGLTPQVTPFARKLRAGGFEGVQPSAFRSSVFGRSTGPGTAKSVRFARSSRFTQSIKAGEDLDEAEENVEQEGDKEELEGAYDG